MILAMDRNRTVAVLALACLTVWCVVTLLEESPYQALISPAESTGRRRLLGGGGTRLDAEYYLTHKSPANLPSVIIEKPVDQQRTIYGGKKDKEHLGGFLHDVDMQGVSHNLWNFMMSQLTVKSVVDVGCGIGYSTKYFLDAGARVLCVEGSHDAVTSSLLPSSVVVEHDFSRGPWWPEETYDAAWSIEFLEHVGRQYHDNYMGIFKKAAIVFASASQWGGWHHVEVHGNWWWESRFTANGFIYSHELTKIARLQALNDWGAQANPHANSNGQHIRNNVMVFINPAVASLPQHSHLFGGHGCYNDIHSNADGGKPCQGVDALPLDKQPLMYCSRKNTNKERIINTIWSCSKNTNLVK